VAGFISEPWPGSNRNDGRHQFGTGGRLASESAPDSSEVGTLLAEQGLGPADLDRALARLETTEGTTVRAIVWINEDGVFGTNRQACRPDLDDACHEPFIPLLWLKLHELLGRVPAGSTARFIRDGTLPGVEQSASVDRIAS
jgi:hypothetical protein